MQLLQKVQNPWTYRSRYYNDTVPQVVDAVSIPVIAWVVLQMAEVLRAAMMLGAEAVQMGTRFVVAKESIVHENYKKKVLAKKISILK